MIYGMATKKKTSTKAKKEPVKTGYVKNQQEAGGLPVYPVKRV
jgi:hypothetical protein